MAPLSVQDVNADGYDDCIVWMGQPARTSLQVIDGKTGEHRYGFLSIDGESAVISGSHLIYVTETSSRPFNTREQVTSPPQVALTDLRTGQLVARETLPRGTLSLELFALGKDVIAHTSAGDLYVSVEQGKIAPSGAIYKTKAQLVGARGAPPPETFRLEQALGRLGWAAPVAESGAQRAIQTRSWWVVPRDRNYGHLAMLEPSTLERSWEIDIGEGAIAELAAGEELAAAVLRSEGQSDALVLVDLSARRVAFRYQRE